MSRAAAISAFEGLGAIRVIEREPPTPGDDEVRVRIRVAAVHPIDGVVASGDVPTAKPPPLILGAVGAGDVETESSAFHIGDRVAIVGAELGVRRDGVWADHAIVPERLLLRLPSSVGYATGACLGIAFPTALLAAKRLRLTVGASVLVLGASGAVGSASLQFARRMGLRVVAATRTAPGAQFAAELGANETINLSTTSLADAATALTDGGFDAVIDPVGGGLTRQALQALKPRGVHVVVGYAAGTETNLALTDLVNTGRTLRGVNLAIDGPEGLRSAEEEALAAMASGELRAPVGALIDLEDLVPASMLRPDPHRPGRVLVVL